MAMPTTTTCLQMPQFIRVSQLTSHQQSVGIYIPTQSLISLSCRGNYRALISTCVVTSGLKQVGTNAAPMEDISVVLSTTESGKIKVNVSGTKSEAIFEDVFSKMVAAAQPIPGFRRVKGVLVLLVGHVVWNLIVLLIYFVGLVNTLGNGSSGKTPNIPREVLLEILGPSKVYKQVIKEIISSAVAEYVEKEKLNVTKDLRVEQSFEELEASYEPGEEFSFDAILQLQHEEE
ncbi:hypothetical protein IFM89_034879 [Coptis chinensis]|uniref:Trigger factor ribosome-binding bacterial domain-containing protein n=1 Tax=Coptis chinensis TaxID=261450 RepID=A0A835M5Q9_9MAGN|nr:hypothetical protein IFM89_034879 [Coptis chinensis]